jgi:MFS family permease
MVSWSYATPLSVEGRRPSLFHEGSAAMSLPGAATSGRSASSHIYSHRAIEPVELPSVMRKHIYTGVMGAIYGAMVLGVFFGKYWKEIGGDPVLWTVLSAFLSLATVAQLVSAYLTSRTGARKRLWYRAELISRLLRLASVASSALLWYRVSSAAACWALILFATAGSFFTALASAPWQSWLSSIIPANRHGWFMGRRGAWVSLGAMAVVLPAGWLMDAAGKSWTLPVLLGLFGVGIAMGLVDLWIHRTIPEPPIEANGEADFWAEVRRPLEDRRFRPFLIFQGCWMFSMGMAGSLTWPFWTDVLHIDSSMGGTALLIVGAPLGLTVLLGKWIGVMVDRLGARRMLGAGSLLWACIPALWLFATAENCWAVLCIWAVLSATGCTAALQAAGKIQIRTAPPHQAASYVAVGTVVAALAAAAGDLTSGGMFRLLKGVALTIGPWSLGAYTMIFLASTILRFSSILLISGVREPTGTAMTEEAECEPAHLKGSPKPCA